MRNAWRVYIRDLKRLGKVPLAWVIIIGALLTPSLYAWFNIVAFWNPFDNTKNLSIAVVNLDEGATSELTGELNVGDQLVEQLKDNTDLGWQFLSEEDAMTSIKSGESFAAFVMPADFSKDLLSLTTGDFTQPKIEYYVNEKLNGVAPEITDTGATTIQTQMIDSFTQQVASAAATAIQKGGGSAEERISATQSKAIDEIESAAAKIAETRTHLEELQSGIGTTREDLGAAKNTLTSMETSLSDLKIVLNDATRLADQAQTKLLELTTSATGAYAASATRIAHAAADADTAVSKLTQGMEQAESRLESQIDTLTETKNGIADIRALLESGTLTVDPALQAQLAAELAGVETKVDNVISVMQTAYTTLASGSAGVQGAADAAAAASQNAAAAAESVNAALSEHLPALQRPMAELSAAAHGLSAALDSQQVILAEATQLLSELSDQLGATSTALSSLDGNLASLQADMTTVVTDLRTLSGAAAWQQLTQLTTLDPEQIASFMATPVLVKQITLFETNSYGSLMGSLFINLSLWIASFVLVVIMKLEVDRDGIPNLTERQRYMGRWFLFASIAILQAVVLSIGNLIIGVQHVNPFVFVITPVLIGLCFSSIIYALSVTFGYIGKGLCVVLVIMQIPGASGIYPIELMPQFFQSLYPFFPFSYGIDAMREVISGFAGFAYFKYMGMLLLFTALAFFLGLVLRNSVSNLTRLFTQEVGSTGLFTTEEGILSTRGYRVNHMLRALSNRAEYKQRVARRTLNFVRSYRKVRGAIIAAGVLGIALIMSLALIFPEHKTGFVGLWIVWLLLVFVSLVTLEYIRYSLQLSTEVGEMPEEEIRSKVAELEATK